MTSVREHLRVHIAVYREHAEEAAAKHERAARSLRDDALTPGERKALSTLAHVYDCEARRNLQWANALDVVAGELDV